jgi:hypothetical protein
MHVEFPDQSPLISAGNARVQLIEFLSTQLNLAFTMLRTAEAGAASDPDKQIPAIASVRGTLRIVRRLGVGWTMIITGRLKHAPSSLRMR